ncbi:MAG: hypothetical protein JWL83_1080 [Actinomycetia bacterium]|nr:hypothetical protein [Actinomycetes bacterium]
MTVDPRADARRVVGDAYEVRVLEPSPPAVRDEPFSDDPPARGVVPPGRRVVAPVTDGDVTWDELCREQESLARWCAERWLGPWPPLSPVSDADAFARTRESWHALAEHVVCAKRHRANGKIGLRWVRDGFGTPFFGADEQVRIAGGTVSYVTDREERTEPITTIGAAAAFLGIAPGVPGDLFEPNIDGDPNRFLPIDVAAAALLAAWFGFATSALAQLRVDLAYGRPSLIQLWPEHFDLATDIGDGGSGGRANYGASPGDERHPEPYLYVGPWDASRIADGSGFWNEPFGASLPYAAVAGTPESRTRALAFFTEGARRLAD